MNLHDILRHWLKPQIPAYIKRAILKRLTLELIWHDRAYRKCPARPRNAATRG